MYHLLYCGFLGCISRKKRPSIRNTTNMKFLQHQHSIKNILNCSCITFIGTKRRHMPRQTTLPLIQANRYAPADRPNSNHRYLQVDTFLSLKINSFRTKAVNQYFDCIRRIRELFCCRCNSLMNTLINANSVIEFCACIGIRKCRHGL